MKTKATVLVTVFLLLATIATAQDMPKHRFFDKENVTLFSALAVTRAMDCDSTWRFRAKGYQEGELTNGLVDNKPAFVAFSAAMVGAQIGGSYILHRLGWHRAERWTSAVHVGMVGGTALNNYRLR